MPLSHQTGCVALMRDIVVVNGQENKIYLWVYIGLTNTCTTPSPCPQYFGTQAGQRFSNELLTLPASSVMLVLSSLWQTSTANPPSSSHHTYSCTTGCHICTESLFLSMKPLHPMHHTGGCNVLQ